MIHRSPNSLTSVILNALIALKIHQKGLAARASSRTPLRSWGRVIISTAIIPTAVIPTAIIATTGLYIYTGNKVSGCSRPAS
jgi:hypothetical protein